MGGVEHENKRNLYGIIGHPVARSLSPAMHRAAFKAANINAEYRLFDIDPSDEEELANFTYETDLNHIGGFSVTMPYKVAIMHYMEAYDPLAKIVGSVNTVLVDDSNLYGHNTDATGAITALREKRTLPGQRVLIMGAGGAARAIAYGVKESGCVVTICNRTLKKANELAKEFELDVVELHDVKAGDFDIIINTTPVGMYPNSNESLLNAEQISKTTLVMDIITSPLETQLIKEAKKAGADVVTGERMLLHQAVGQFEIWFNKEAPVEAMETALYEELKRRS